MAILIGIVAVALFAMACLAVWNVAGNLDLERHAEKETPAVSVAGLGGDRCMLCDAPLRRLATRDEVLSAIERHIGAENDRVMQILRRPEPENFQQLYLA